MQLAVAGGDMLDRHDMTAVKRAHETDAGIDALIDEAAGGGEAADQHRAGAAVAFGAAFLGAGAAGVLTQPFQQRARGRDAVQRDRARTKILRISQFGIIEMTRQRIRPSLKRSAFMDCTHCKGTGHVKTSESVSIEVMRMLQLAVNRGHISRIDIRVHDDVALYLLNRKRKEIVALEEQGGKQISITSAGAAVSLEFLEFMCYDTNGNEVKFTLVDEPPPRPPQRRGRR